MAIVTLGDNDSGSTSRTVINDNFSDLDTTKADLASPALTGDPTAPTQTAGDNSTKIATTAYVATAVSASTDVSCHVYQNVAGSTGSSTYSVQSFGVERFDTDGMHSTSVNTSRITIATAGKYMFGGQIYQDTQRNTAAQVLLNGTTIIANNCADPLMNPTSVTVCGFYSFIAGDYIELYGASNGAGTTSGDSKTNFWAYKIN